MRNRLTLSHREKRGCQVHIGLSACSATENIRNAHSQPNQCAQGEVSASKVRNLDGINDIDGHLRCAKEPYSHHGPIESLLTREETPFEVKRDDELPAKMKNQQPVNVAQRGRVKKWMTNKYTPHRACCIFRNAANGMEPVPSSERRIAAYARHLPASLAISSGDIQSGMAGGICFAYTTEK